jgi:hypothetical protein
MNISTNIHSVLSVRADNYYPDNSHSVRLRIEGKTGAWEITTFDLPEDKALALVQALGDELTTVYTPAGTVSLRDYIAERQVYNAIEEESA